MNFPSQLVENAVEQLSSLPGIGKKSALRLVLHILKRESYKYSTIVKWLFLILNYTFLIIQ